MKIRLYLPGFLALLLILVVSCSPGSQAPSPEKHGLSSDTLALATQIDPSTQMIVITLAQLMPGDYSYAYEFHDLVKRSLIKD